MRVYEYAKEKNLTSKEILTLLKEAGFDIHTHMSVLTKESKDALDKLLLPKPDIKTEEPKVKTEKKEPTLNKSEIIKKPKTEETKKEMQLNVIKKEKSEIVDKGKLQAIVAQKHPSRPQIKQEFTFKKQAFDSLKTEPESVSEMLLDKEMSLFEVANSLKKSVSELITVFLKKGKVFSRNQILDIPTIAELLTSLGIKAIYPEKKSIENFIAKSSSEGVTRWPVVVVMGHVDHGKTSLLDYIRKTNVTAHEKGGITQHIGAYEVDSAHGRITFLDTPGHAAFSQMRRRGAKVTDIAVLVVAADDGIMPQTLEAIESAREAKLPIIVAINKIDKVGSTAPIEGIKRQLAQYNLLPEDWGGTTICIPISAKTGQGIDNLLEMIVLQTQLMDLRARVDVPSKGYVIESKVEKGYGSVATVIPFEGILSVGDYFICGSVTGKVRLLIDSFGKKIQKADPSTPVVIIGFDKIATSGDMLEVVNYEKYLQYRAGKEEFNVITPAIKGFAQSESSDNSINLILKSDTFGTSEALINSIKTLTKKSKSTKTLKVVYNGVGDITERDIDLAINTNSIILGLHTKVERNAAVLAKEQNVEIKIHQIIYKLLEELEQLLAKYKEKIITWKKSGEATVLKVFDIKGIGIVAGSYVSEGVFSKNCKVVCMRRGRQVGEGRIASLERNKKSVKEIHSGLEFGLISTGFSDWQVDDIIHCFLEVVEQA